MTDIKLPAGYEGWVEAEYPGADSERLRVMFEYFPSDGYGTQKKAQWFVPPKPKPSLPDVKPGAVVRYVDKTGKAVRAVFRSARVWDIYYQPHAPLNTACHASVIGDDDVLASVDDNGFTVELEGL